MGNKIISVLSSVKFDSYKSFRKNGPYAIQLGSNITLLIGRNNCGKSSIIDVFEKLVGEKQTKNYNEEPNRICPTFILDEEHIERGFSKNSHVRVEKSDFAYGRKYINRALTLQIDNSNRYIAEDQEDYMIDLNEYGLSSNWDNIARAYARDLENVRFRRINADRDIIPEIEDHKVKVDENGNGATNLIREYINNAIREENVVEKTILQELNKIVGSDAHFDSIRVQQVYRTADAKYYWEIYLEENGEKYAMSKCGSGLKTILLILINLYLVPVTDEYRYNEILYAFEEIENNLHPALQRRVFKYLYDYAINKNIKILITTHSHIAINSFFGKNNTKMYHVIKEEGHSKIMDVDNGEKKEEILDDLDVKASDLFQTNGVIWVEGPSDRVYLLHWLNTFTNFEYIEGLHFQFCYYGGRLLAHYEANEQEQRVEGLINVLTINRHAAIVIDSDKTSRNMSINDTKKRIRDEFEKKNRFCWITKGKEIENYVSSEAVNETYKCDLPQIGQYQKFPDYIRNIDKYFENNKVDVARRMCEHITLENSESIMDLKEKIKQLYEEIKQWNVDEAYLYTK